MVSIVLFRIGTEKTLKGLIVSLIGLDQGVIQLYID